MLSVSLLLGLKSSAIGYLPFPEARSESIVEPAMPGNRALAQEEIISSKLMKPLTKEKERKSRYLARKNKVEKILFEILDFHLTNFLKASNQGKQY